jgi:response regulator RpfG family c-di-GMP phosphodiesterase
MSTSKILYVDDSINILISFKKILELHYEVVICENPVEALKIVVEQGPFAAVVADLHMPQMSGLQLLDEVRKLAPDTVRIMAAGSRDFADVIDAINNDQVFRLIPKPFSSAVLTQVLNACVDHYYLRFAEKQLLELTLHRSIRLLVDALSVANPAAFSRASRLRRLAASISRRLGLADPWHIEIAAMLAWIGSIALPESLLEKADRGSPLTEDERRAIARIPQLGHDLVANVPRLEMVALAILYQDKGYDGSGRPEDEVAGEQLPIAARILKAARDFDNLVERQFAKEAALAELIKRSSIYDPHVLGALGRVVGEALDQPVRAATLDQLESRMVLAEDVLSGEGPPVLRKGQELSSLLLARLREFASLTPIREPIRVVAIGD